MRFFLVSGDFSIIDCIGKAKWPAVLGCIFLILGLSMAILVTCEVFYKTESSEIKLESPLRILPNKKVTRVINPLPVLFYPDGQEDVDAEQERFRITRKFASDTLLMAAPIARVSVKVVGLLCDKDNHAGMVIIDGSGRQQSYVSGEAINDTYPIMKIFSDRIVINENGFYAALMLEN
ncbi:type II secretion system protein N [Serratia proteamaculans]|uniref:Type II secretion system protein GspC N-terminal domain-containing protein n=1 Tax=Serratia proteamaculans TaxID=28151 RepID=A0A5Q2VEU9_SERPR|nr:type II secretion system protein N [Serratia proteamaculans]QGH61913.1 hypothetical protein GHV41_14220 [Serratia proteamaculans]